MIVSVRWVGILDSIDERDPSLKLVEPSATAQSTPAFPRTVPKLGGETQTPIAGDVSASLHWSQPHGGERRLDGDGRADGLPVRGREVVERQQRRPVLCPTNFSISSIWLLASALIGKR